MKPKRNGFTHKFVGLYNRVLAIGKKGDASPKNKDKSSSLLRACYQKNKELVKLLIKHGADINIKDKNGNTLLIWASWNNYQHIVKLLLEKGAHIEAKNKEEDTALLRAAMNNNKDIVELLTKYGADVNTKDNEGNTALHWSQKNKNKELAKFLIKAGADLCALTKPDSFKKLFQKEYRRCSLLHAKIKKLKKHKKEMKHINELMLDPLTPIFAKQSALGELLKYYSSNKLKKNELLSYCKEILFNYRFFNDNNLKQVLDFAVKADAKDKLGRSVFEVSLLSCGENEKDKIVSKLFERIDLCNSLRVYLSQKNNEEKKISNEFIDALRLAKKNKYKKIFKSLLYSARCFGSLSGYRADKKKPLPSEIVSNIMSFVRL